MTVVCSGNICRSPMAEVVLRAAFADAGLPDVEVDSAGIGDWHVGDPADPRAVATLRAHGYDGRGHRARQVAPSQWRPPQLVLAADRGHLRRLRAIGVPAGVEVRLLRGFDPRLADADERDPELDLADPYYDDGFEQVLQMVQAAVPAVVAYVAGVRR